MLHHCHLAGSIKTPQITVDFLFVRPFYSVCALAQTHDVCIILPENVVNIYGEEGETVMKQDEIRRRLIDGTIHVIAREGLDGASTKQIGIATATNEAYIYRCFEDKEDMFAKAFASLDDELLAVTMKHVEIMYMQEMEFEVRCRFYFSAVWKCLLEDRDGCLTYMRYFYSPYFTKYSAGDHEKRFKPLLEKFSPAFKDEADVWMILNHILNVMLDFVVKVHNGHMSASDDYAEHVFRVIYASVKQYFRNSKESDS
jgi:AcrR family transcriptional regulator